MPEATQQVCVSEIPSQGPQLSLPHTALSAGTCSFGPIWLQAAVVQQARGASMPPTVRRFFGTKWMMFLAVGIYALFVSTNYWERYYTLVPSAVALGMAIVPLWASMGNYITR